MAVTRKKDTRSSRIRKWGLFIPLALILALLLVFSQVAKPAELVRHLGEWNGYLVVFLVSFVAGFSAFTTISFYSMLIAFLSGGMNPYLLGLVAGTSFALGDMFLFYFGRKGRDILSGKLDRKINRVASYFRYRKLEKYIPVLSYLYISIIPLPNDWLLLFLASIRYPQRNMNIIITLGDFTHVYLLTFLTSRGIMIFG